ncbi:hypothetical protein VNO77_00956 [Canavalia gladiata]|uniref:Uncharacterized protein n=1 Tax=Canavalia gladiata TaxID=3824 RepID=A0AAN9R4J3_CANGL
MTTHAVAFMRKGPQGQSSGPGPSPYTCTMNGFEETEHVLVAIVTDSTDPRVRMDTRDDESCLHGSFRYRNFIHGCFLVGDWGMRKTPRLTFRTKKKGSARPDIRLRSCFHGERQLWIYERRLLIFYRSINSKIFTAQISLRPNHYYS